MAQASIGGDYGILGKIMITQDYVKSIFDYVDGRLVCKQGMRKESRRHSYMCVKIYKVLYYSHRLIWLYHTGRTPKYLDHIDGNTFNNRIENLREATMSQNIANADFGSVRGVEAHGAKFRARIWVDNKRIELGSFPTFVEAVQAYDNGATHYYGEYAYCQRP